MFFDPSLRFCLAFSAILLLSFAPRLPISAAAPFDKPFLSGLLMGIFGELSYRESFEPFFYSGIIIIASSASLYAS